MGPPAFAMLIAGIAAPLLARRIRPGYVIAAALGLSAIGYLLLARLEHGPSGIALVTAAFSLVYIGLGTIAALGTDMVVGSVPPQNAGSASGMSETVQELGLAVGIAALGSLTTAIYRSSMLHRVPEFLPEDIRGAVGDSLAGATSVLSEIPAALLDEAQAAFMAGFNAAAATSAVAVALLAMAAAVALRNVGMTGGPDEDETTELRRHPSSGNAAEHSEPVRPTAAPARNPRSTP